MHVHDEKACIVCRSPADKQEKIAHYHGMMVLRLCVDVGLSFHQFVYLQTPGHPDIYHGTLNHDHRYSSHHEYPYETFDLFVDLVLVVAAEVQSSGDGMNNEAALVPSQSRQYEHTK